MMKLVKQTITPKLAEKYLKTNTVNRRVKPNVITKYANEMSGGRWRKDTGETIKISHTGRLLDGQHRLMAVIESGKNIEMLVANDVPDDNFKVIDTGVSRNASDSFRIEGISSYTLIPAIIGLWHVLKKGGRGGGEAHKAPSVIVTLDLYHKRPLFWDATAEKADGWYRAFNRIIYPKIIGALYVIFNEISPEDAEAFWEQLCTGINVKNTTISYLRNKLINDKLSPRKMGRNFKLALIIKTWNYFRKNDTPDGARNLKFDPSKESFPKPI